MNIVRGLGVYPIKFTSFIDGIEITNNNSKLEFDFLLFEKRIIPYSRYDIRHNRNLANHPEPRSYVTVDTPPISFSLSQPGKVVATFLPGGK